MKSILSLMLISLITASSAFAKPERELFRYFISHDPFVGTFVCLVSDRNYEMIFTLSPDNNLPRDEQVAGFKALSNRLKTIGGVPMQSGCYEMLSSNVEDIRYALSNESDENYDDGRTFIESDRLKSANFYGGE